ncbi:accessory gene regulator B family protein [Clostridium sediminicola]|uniref:accessory gene regulator ArgB-like protein n=1 Tax=Clostridium sediminicola TaxID=3114879 RepID=UPI0031F2163D
MFLIEKLSNGIGSKFASILKLDKDHEEIVTYGAFIFLQKLWAIFIVLVIGTIFGVLIEALFIFFTSSLLRKYSGGVHASSPNGCAIIGAIVTVILALIIKVLFRMISIEVAVILGIISFIISYYVIYKLAPVDSPEKPIVKFERKQYLKRCSIRILNILLVFTNVLLFIYFKYKIVILLNFIGCIWIGSLWQVFTLTSKGHKVIFIFDSIFNRIFNIISLKEDLNEE